MTNVEALKNLYVALGGMIDDVEDFNLSVEVINAIAGIAGSGGSSLPAVTAEDNDKVLTVVEGAWDKAVPSGGGDVLVVRFTGNPVDGFTVDKTFTEIYEASQSGKIIVASLNGGTTGFAQRGDFENFEFTFLSFNLGSTAELNILYLNYNVEGQITGESGVITCDS